MAVMFILNKHYRFSALARSMHLEVWETAAHSSSTQELFCSRVVLRTGGHSHDSGFGIEPISRLWIPHHAPVAPCDTSERAVKHHRVRIVPIFSTAV